MTTRRQLLKTAALGAAAKQPSRSWQRPHNTGDYHRAKAVVPQVDRRVLGRIGTPVSILGLGLGSAFTKPYGKDFETAEKLLNEALRHGVNYWDTAKVMLIVKN